ncbi:MULTISPECIES: hypothetical protein [Dehalococcoides]|jgi:hypothetical protein|uniref:Uncharacterized protein n=1 Tax=bioreactor metagenome TaxID=1076179 RepID=A0A644WT49_9ZZZZ|nr:MULTISPECIES: hypothetical protein [Dehalococcoides]
MMEIKIGYLLLSADLHQPGDVDITLTTGDGTLIAVVSSKTLITAIEVLEKTAE